MRLVILTPAEVRLSSSVVLYLIACWHVLEGKLHPQAEWSVYDNTLIMRVKSLIPQGVVHNENCMLSGAKHLVFNVETLRFAQGIVQLFRRSQIALPDGEGKRRNAEPDTTLANLFLNQRG